MFFSLYSRQCIQRNVIAAAGRPTLHKGCTAAGRTNPLAPRRIYRHRSGAGSLSTGGNMRAAPVLSGVHLCTDGFDKGRRCVCSGLFGTGRDAECVSLVTSSCKDSPPAMTCRGERRAGRSFAASGRWSRPWNPFHQRTPQNVLNHLGCRIHRFQLYHRSLGASPPIAVVGFSRRLGTSEGLFPQSGYACS